MSANQELDQAKQALAESKIQQLSEKLARSEQDNKHLREEIAFLEEDNECLCEDIAYFEDDNKSLDIMVARLQRGDQNLEQCDQTLRAPNIQFHNRLPLALGVLRWMMRINSRARTKYNASTSLTVCPSRRET